MKMHANQNNNPFMRMGGQDEGNGELYNKDKFDTCVRELDETLIIHNSDKILIMP